MYRVTANKIEQFAAEFVKFVDIQVIFPNVIPSIYLQIFQNNHKKVFPFS